MTFPYYEKLAEYLKQGPVLQLTVIRGEEAGETLLTDGKRAFAFGKETAFAKEELEAMPLWSEVYKVFEPERCPYTFSVGAKTIFAERVATEAELVICGGGHVSLELSALAEFMDYPYTVIDDREEFANRERFPKAKAVCCGDFTEILRKREFSANACFIIVTRGHEHDLECLELLLNRPYSYVGMIGSRAKVQRVMTALEEKGYSKEKLSTVHAPIGLKIGGQTPKEIAVSILAELILCRNTALPASILEAGLLEVIFNQKKLVMVRIIDKKGSAPRGIGSRMLVGERGILYGTIGGGVVEYKAAEHARTRLGMRGCETVRYGLNEASAAALGMWCGGEVEVLFESVEEE